MSKAREYALEQRVNQLNAVLSEQQETIEAFKTLVYDIIVRCQVLENVSEVCVIDSRFIDERVKPLGVEIEQ